MTRSYFLNPSFCLIKMDTYIVHYSILSAIKNNLLHFHGTLLDVGCGQMPYKPLFVSNQSKVTKYIGLDLEDNPIHSNKPDITWKNGRIPLDDESIDCAIATEVFEHCPEPDKVVGEISRVLKPKGLLFFTAPFLWPLHEVPYDEYRYTPFSLERILNQNGFSNIDIKPLGGWDASMAQMLGLWARRRPMGRLSRIFFSILLLPFIYILCRTDKRLITRFSESAMITGITGTALKKQ